MNNVQKSFDQGEFPFQKETGIIIGVAMEIHRILGKGFLEIVYNDAFEYECIQRHLFFEREKEFIVPYKTVILPHRFYADFIIFEKIIVEIKSQRGIPEEHYTQTINYLAVSKCPVGLIFNFSERSLQFKRVVLTKS